MNLILEIGYEQLLQLFRQLPPKQKKQFLKEIEKEVIESIKHENSAREPENHYLKTTIQLAATISTDDDTSGDLSLAWSDSTTRQFLAGYSESDSIYDKI